MVNKKISSFKSILSKILIVVVVALLYVGGMWFYRRSQSDLVTNPETEVPTNSEQNESSGVYKNGTFSATGTYISPGGTETVNLSITIINDIVTATNFTAEATVPTSEFFQEDFIANYKTQVIGKKISDLNLTKVSGSSLTPLGFNNALAKIKNQAKF